MDDPFSMVETVKEFRKRLIDLQNLVTRAEANARIFDNLRKADNVGVQRITIDIYTNDNNLKFDFSLYNKNHIERVMKLFKEIMVECNEATLKDAQKGLGLD